MGKRKKTVARKTKHPKPSKNKEVYDGHSRMCDLPDEVLIHILSFLPTKDAVRTSVLSRRWKYLWTYTPELRFDGRCSFVERALHLRARHQPPLRVFALKSFPIRKKVSHIKAWITSAVGYNVQELDLSFTHPCLSITNMDTPESDLPYPLPPCIFKCQTLVKLYLELDTAGYRRTKTILWIPSSVWLPSLKVLSLSQVKFADCASVEKLLSRPPLEELVIRECDWENNDTLWIDVPELRVLRIEDNLEYEGCHIYIDAVSLQYFSYRGDLISEYRFDGISPEFVEAAIYLDCSRTYIVNYRHTLLSSLAVAGVQNLTLRFDFLENLVSEEDILQSQELLDALPEFSKMTKIEVDMFVVSHGWMSLMGILIKSPFLQSLKITMAIGVHIDEFLDNYFELEPVPLCFLTELKKIELLMYWPDGRDHTDSVIPMAAILLKKAMVLEELILNCPMEMWINKDFLYLLRILPRGSKNCRISLANFHGKFTLAQ